MVYTENGTKIEEGIIIRGQKVRQSTKNTNDGIVWIDRFAVIVKDAKVSTNAVMLADIKIQSVRPKYAFAVLI